MKIAIPNIRSQLKVARKEAGLRQQDIAAQLSEILGKTITREHVGAWERGTYQPRALIWVLWHKICARAEQLDDREDAVDDE